jgi:hypothetical protein
MFDFLSFFCCVFEIFMARDEVTIVNVSLVLHSTDSEREEHKEECLKIVPEYRRNLRTQTEFA